jgi:hypothetical protein
MFTCIFALARTVGWMTQWEEMITDPEYKIGRPRQLYIGAARRDVPPWTSAEPGGGGAILLSSRFVYPTTTATRIEVLPQVTA